MQRTFFKILLFYLSYSRKLWWLEFSNYVVLIYNPLAKEGQSFYHYFTVYSSNKVIKKRTSIDFDQLTLFLVKQGVKIQNWISSEVKIYFTCSISYQTILIGLSPRIYSIDIMVSYEKWCYQDTMGKGASFTSGKCKQLTFISVWIMHWTTEKLLLRWDFFLGYNTTNWACLSLQATQGHQSWFPFWCKYQKRHSSCKWTLHS